MILVPTVATPVQVRYHSADIPRQVTLPEIPQQVRGRKGLAGHPLDQGEGIMAPSPVVDPLTQPAQQTGNRLNHVSPLQLCPKVFVSRKS